MEDFIGNIWTFSTVQFTIEVNAYCDYDIDLSFDETGEVAEKLNSGEYVGFTVKAVLLDKHTGRQLAVDYLGGCIHESIETFKDNVGVNKHKNCGSYFSDMVHALVKEGRNVIQMNAKHYSRLASEIKPA